MVYAISSEHSASWNNSATSQVRECVWCYNTHLIIYTSIIVFPVSFMCNTTVDDYHLSVAVLFSFLSIFFPWESNAFSPIFICVSFFGLCSMFSCFCFSALPLYAHAQTYPTSDLLSSPFTNPRRVGSALILRHYLPFLILYPCYSPGILGLGWDISPASTLCRTSGLLHLWLLF